MSATKEHFKHMDQLHAEHRVWASATKLYADELTIYQQRLDELAGKNNSIDIRKSIAHFQNQFIIQKEQLDILNHGINRHEHALANYAQKYPVAVDHVLFADHTALRDESQVFVKLFEDLRREFFAFLNENL